MRCLFILYERCIAMKICVYDILDYEEPILKTIKSEVQAQLVEIHEPLSLETLEAAKTLMADISSSAEKRADILLKNAELDAQLMQKEAKETADRIAEESAAMRNRFIDFRSRYKRLLESELQRFESLSGDLFPEFGVDDFDDLPQSPAGSDTAPAVERYTVRNVRNQKY